MENNELLKKVCRYLNPYPQNLCLSLRPRSIRKTITQMITQYTCYYNAIKRWESNHKETEILHQLEISNLLEQLKNN